MLKTQIHYWFKEGYVVFSTRAITNGKDVLNKKKNDLKIHFLAML